LQGRDAPVAGDWPAAFSYGSASLYQAVLMSSLLATIRARWAVATIFGLHGFIWGSWVPHIPLAKERLAVGEGLFGVALLGIAVGAVIAMPLAGALINRYGSAVMTTLTGIGFFLAFFAPVLAPTLPLFILGGAIYGACIGSMDVSMNSHGLLVEKTLQVPTMSLYHGLFSVGGFLGAFAGAAALSVMNELAHAALVSGICLAVHLVAVPFLLPTHLDKGLSGSHFAWPTPATIGLGLLCFLALMAEGSIIDWSAILLTQRFGIDAGMAALGYGLFSAGMAVTRLLGDGWRKRFGAVRLVTVSGAVTAIAMAISLAMPDPVMSIIALGIAGLGLGNVAPVLFAGGGRLEPDAPGRGIAAVTTLGYAGFLAGPPLIGFTAEVTGLTLALGLTALAAAIIALTARAVAPADTY
jgi:MFS family permease